MILRYVAGVSAISEGCAGKYWQADRLTLLNITHSIILSQRTSCYKMGTYFLVKPNSMSHTKGQSLIIPVDTAVSNCGEVVFMSKSKPMQWWIRRAPQCCWALQRLLALCRRGYWQLPGTTTTSRRRRSSWMGGERGGGSAWRQKDPSTTFTFILL